MKAIKETSTFSIKVFHDCGLTEDEIKGSIIEAIRESVLLKHEGISGISVGYCSEWWPF